MLGLSGSQLLQAWESGYGRAPHDRALAVLRAGSVQGGDELASLPVGRRDALLLELRERTFGGCMPCFLECRQCGERLEFEIHTADLRVRGPSEFVGELECLGHRLRFRLPDSRDLAVMARSPGPAAAARVLLDRCVLAAERDGHSIAANELAPEVVAALAERMAAMDPGADHELALVCPACEHSWQAMFDIESYLWAEIAAGARRLLGDVHTLARAYGWPESEILQMTPARRQAYLNMVVA